jgi:hypothetical protein
VNATGGRIGAGGAVVVRRVDEPWMRREIHLAHAAGSERPEDDETGEDLSFAQQGHGGIVSTHAAESR